MSYWVMAQTLVHLISLLSIFNFLHICTVVLGIAFLRFISKGVRMSCSAREAVLAIGGPADLPKGSSLKTAIKSGKKRQRRVEITYRRLFT